MVTLDEPIKERESVLVDQFTPSTDEARSPEDTKNECIDLEGDLSPIDL